MIWKVLTFLLVFFSASQTFLLFERCRERSALHEPRLLGTWVSDKERTIEQLTDIQKDKLSDLFGQLRITYTGSTYTTELDGSRETVPYTVLGTDKHSVVIRDDSTPAPELEILETSTFSKIHFDSPDSYWVITEIGGLTEYFRRVRSDEK